MGDDACLSHHEGGTMGKIQCHKGLGSFNTTKYNSHEQSCNSGVKRRVRLKERVCLTYVYALGVF